MLFRIRFFFILILATWILSGTHSVALADTLYQQEVFTIAPDFDIQSRTSVRASLRFVSNKAYWYVADEYWDPLSTQARGDALAAISDLATEFDTRIYPLETAYFGSEPNPGVDNDSRITILLAPLKSTAGGYIDTAHQYPKNIVSVSNAREMIFLNATFLTDRERVRSYLAHEFQHLISFYQKEILLRTSDDVWLNELRSEYAIESLGYYNQSSTNNLQRRAQTLIRNTGDSLTEWKNDSADYGSIAMFAHYLSKTFGTDIIGMTSRDKEPGIRAIRNALGVRGFNVAFDVIFASWWAANILNDSSSSLFGYQLSGLRDLRVRPEKIITLYESRPSDFTSLQLKDWQGGWYQINRSDSTLPFVKLQFDSSSIASFGLALIKVKNDSSYNVSYGSLGIDRKNLTLDFSDPATVLYFVMPFKRDRLSGFGQNEAAVSFSMTAVMTTVPDAAGQIALQPITQDLLKGMSTAPSTSAGSGSATPAQFGLREGDFIRATGDNDVFIINDYGYKRLVINPAICLMYGHLGARGCFSAVKTVAPATRDAFITSFSVTNGETKDGIIHSLTLINDDAAKISKTANSLAEFTISGRDSRSVFLINSKEQGSYLQK